MLYAIDLISVRLIAAVNQTIGGSAMTPRATTTHHLWFLDTLVSVHVASSQGTTGLSLLERRAPYGESPALHLHRAEDEVFYMLEGELRFQVGREEQRL